MAIANPDFGYYACFRREMVEFVPTEARRILDVGCGAGSFGQQLANERGAEVWGIELVEDAATIAKERLHTVLVGSVESTLDKLPEGAFDAIVFNDVLEHLVWPDDVLSSVRSKLAPGGVVVASIPNIRSLSSFYRIVIRGEFPHEIMGIFDKTHLRFFTRTSMIAMFDRAGYDVVAQKGINATKGWKARLALSLPFWPGDMRYLQFACVARPKA